jgi:hypothetical protein
MLAMLERFTPEKPAIGKSIVSGPLAEMVCETVTELEAPSVKVMRTG